MSTKGYGGYHGRNRQSTFLKVLIGVLLALLLLAVAALFVLDRYVVYSADGVRLDLPFFREKEEAEPPVSPPVLVATPAPSAPEPTAEPEQPFQGILLPREALYDGTAAGRVEAAGANAAIFDMKADDGTLGYISQIPLAIQAGVSASDPALNAAIQGLNESGLYTVARVSCFRDNAIPRTDMSLAVKSSAGNWRDSGDVRWLSAANERARAYVAGVCAELAGLGFDEILLDSCAFPSQGRLEYIAAGDNYPADGLTPALEAFFQELELALADYPELNVSVMTEAAALTGGADNRSGQTLALLAEYADRLWLAVPIEGEDYAQALEQAGVTAGRLVTVAGDTTPEDESWAILSQVES